MSKNKEYRNIYASFPDIAISLMYVFAAAGLALLSYYAVTGTYLIRRFNGQESVYIEDDPVKQLIVFGIFLAVILVSGVFWDKCCKKQEKTADLVLVLCTFVMISAGLVYVMNHPYYMDGDQINTFYAAVYACQEGSSTQYEMFQPGGYIGIYPQQKGLVFFYYLLYHIFGDKMFESIQFLHILYPGFILHAGYQALKEEDVSSFARSIYCVMVTACLPLYLYIPYMYGDLGSVAFTFCFAYFLTRYLHTGEKIHIISMCLFGSMAVLLRMQIWILLIAAFIVLFLEYMRRRKIMIIIAGICVAASAILASVGVQKFFEEKSGYKDVDGVPAICWVAMGLQETDGNPGAYNRYNQGTFEENGFNAEAASAVAKEDIRQIIGTMKEEPAYIKWFFGTKLRQEWTAPDMEGISMTSVWNELSGTNPSDAPEWLAEIYSSGDLYNTLINFANRYQSVVYLMALLLAVLMIFRRKEDPKPVMILALIYFLGGLIFFTFWENKSRYVLPFFTSLVLLVPYSVDELRRLFLIMKIRE